MNVELNEQTASIAKENLFNILYCNDNLEAQKNTLNDFSTFCMLGKYCLSENQLSKALFYYSCALKLKQTSSDLWIIVGSLYYATGQSQMANSCLLKANDLKSDINIEKIKAEATNISHNKRNFHRFSCLVR